MARLVRHQATGPIKIEPQEKPIFICACGLSKTYPICDGTHKGARAEEVGILYLYGDDRAPKPHGPDEFGGCTCA